MEDPIKLIYKYKNINHRIQYQLFIFVGFLLEPNIIKIINKIKDLNFYEAITELNDRDYKELINIYGDNWYLKFFVNIHIQTSINLILKTPQKQKTIINKNSKEWYNLHINKFKDSKKMMYSYQYLFKQEREMKERKQRLREKAFIKENEDYTISNIKMQLIQEKNQAGGSMDAPDQAGGSMDAPDQAGGEDNENIEETESNQNIDNISEDIDDADEFDLEELENMYKSKEEIDLNSESTSKLIDNIMKRDEKNITKNDNMMTFPDDKNDLMYDDSLKNLYKKIYIFNNYIFKDDTIKKIKEKICCSIKLNNLFITSGDTKHDSYILPSRQYLWTSNSFIDQTDNIIKKENIMLGQKWIKRSELLKVDVIPNDNIKVYENLKGSLGNLRQDMRKYGSRIRRDEDENNLLEEYDKYIENNEIYMIDLYNELGINYNAVDNKLSTDILRNLFDIYIKIYFFHISSDDLKNVINYINIRSGEENRINEIKHMKQVYQTLNNDLIIENEIIKNVEILIKDDKEYSKYYKDNHITQSVIHAYLVHSNIFGSNLLDLFRIFDNFILSEKNPFIQFQLPDGKMIYKFYKDSEEKDKKAIIAKWFENSPYGISFKIKATQKGGSSNKYIAISLNETGRLEYKIQWKEDDKATINDIKKTYFFVKDLIDKINSENSKLNIEKPLDNAFKYAFINSIQQFEITEKKNINHNDLSNFARYFYPYISLVIEPRKRQAKKKTKKEVTSKFGTYLRYKRVSKYDNEAKIEHRIIYFMRNYEYNDSSLTKEISKQFNITDKIASDKIDEVRRKFPIIKRSRKILKRLENAPKYKPPGIGIDIQGKSRHNYKIRISGARNKSQLDRIIKFMNILIYLYVDTYINKNKSRQNLKEKLDSLTNIAKRRNKVEEIIDIEDMDIKNVKRITNFDKDRLGFRPEKGQSHWSRACQNSGSDKKRQPEQYATNNLNDLLRKGYKFNKKSGFYERIIKKGKKTELLRAAEMTNTKNKGNNIYYACNPEENGDHQYIGFLSRSKNPDDLCMPCCFKKDPIDSKNIEKKNYYLKCMGKNNDIVETKKKTQIDKIYILQDTNKIQEGRFGFLPKTLDIYLNSMMKNKVNIKNHYLVNTDNEYLFKYGIKISKLPFLEAVSSIYDISVSDISSILIKKLKEDKNDILFTSLNSGDIKTQFLSKKEFIKYLENNESIDYDIIADFLSKPNIISEFGINFYIFKRRIIEIKHELEKKIVHDDFILECNNIENDIYREDKDRDNIILLKDDNIYYPIFLVSKPKPNSNIEINNKFKYNKIIDHCLKFYKIGCNKDTVTKFNPGIKYNAKQLNDFLIKTNNKNLLVKYQTIDTRNKCRSVILNNGILLPTYPSGIIDNIIIIKNHDKYLLNIQNTLKNLLFIDKVIPELDFKPVGFQYTEQKNNKYYIVALLLLNNISCIIKPEFFNDTVIKQIAKDSSKKDFIKINISIDDLLDNEIKKGSDNYIIDDRIISWNNSNYNNESYNLFRLELSNYLKINSKIREKIIKILENNKIVNKEKKELLKKIMFKVSNKDLYNISNQIGGNDKDSLLIVNDVIPNINNYSITNKRDICITNIDKNSCNNKYHCKWHYGNCLYSIDNKNLIIFINKIVEEFVKDEMKSKELLSIDNYFVSDIVDQNKFTTRKNQKIIKSDIINVNKILSEIFGEDNIPKIGKRKMSKIGKSINEENIENPLEKLGNMYIQNIIPNNNTIIRAFSNQYYWISNTLYDIDFRNLGYYNNLQTDLTNYFKSNIIDFLKDISNKDYIKENLSDFISKDINSYIYEFGNTSLTISNGIVELMILSKIYNLEIVIFNSYNKIIYIIKDGKNFLKFNLKNYNNNYLKTTINILYEYSGGTYSPNKVKSIYYI